MVILQTDLPNLVHRGKVRDTYDLGDGLLLMVATDRISAFDVVLPNGVPSKGLILARMSAFWFGQTAHIIANHLTGLADELVDNMPPASVLVGFRLKNSPSLTVNGSGASNIASNSTVVSTDPLSTDMPNWNPTLPLVLTVTSAPVRRSTSGPSISWIWIPPLL